MLFNWFAGSLHHQAIALCIVAALGLFGALWMAFFATAGKGIFAFLNGSRQPTVIVVNQGGHYVQQPQKRGWSFGRYWLLFAAIFSGGPMLHLLILAVLHLEAAVVAWLQVNWIYPLAVLVIAGVAAVVWWLIVRDRPVAYVEPAHELQPALDATLEPTVPIWSMNAAAAEAWDRRR